MIKSNYIVFDCETGGLDESKNPITQYAAVILDCKSLNIVTGKQIGRAHV